MSLSKLITMKIRRVKEPKSSNYVYSLQMTPLVTIDFMSICHKGDNDMLLVKVTEDVPWHTITHMSPSNKGENTMLLV